MQYMYVPGQVLLMNVLAEDRRALAALGRRFARAFGAAYVLALDPNYILWGVTTAEHDGDHDHLGRGGGGGGRPRGGDRSAPAPRGDDDDELDDDDDNDPQVRPTTGCTPPRRARRARPRSVGRRARVGAERPSGTGGAEDGRKRSRGVTAS